ncbi:MAG: WG repeat-containing protein [Bacteroidia bacterium]
MNWRVLLGIMLISWCADVSSQPYFLAKANGKYGYLNSKGDWVIPAQFTQASLFEKNKAIATRNDSMFLVLDVNDYKYLPDLRNYSFLNSENYAIQNKEGKWALADSTLNAIGEFVYDKIENFAGIYKVQQNFQFGLLDRKANLILSSKFYSLIQLSNQQILGANGTHVSVFSFNDSLSLVLEVNNLKYNLEFNNLYYTYDKSLKQLNLYNLEGEKFYSCSRCALVKSFGSFVFIKNKSKIELLDVKKNEAIQQFATMDSFSFQFNKKHLMLNKINGELYSDTSSNPIAILPRGSDSIAVASEDYYYVRINSEWGLLDAINQVFFPKRFKRISILENGFMQADLDSISELYHLPTSSPILRVPLYTQFSIDSSSILIKHSKGSKLYAYNESFQMTDSLFFQNVSYIRLGNRIISSTAAFQSNLSNFTSKNSNWFQKGERFGLLSSNKKDTLLRPVISSVNCVNDSIDIVSLSAPTFKMKFVQNFGFVVSYNLYGVVNNRTGNFLTKFNYRFMDFKQFEDSSFNAARVVLRDGDFALMDKNSFQVIEESVCSYISPEKNSHMRLFYKAQFRGVPNRFKKNIPYKPYPLVTANAFCEFGNMKMRIIGNDDRVYVSAEGINVADKNGVLKWDDSIVKKLAFLEYGKYNILSQLIRTRITEF